MLAWIAYLDWQMLCYQKFTSKKGNKTLSAIISLGNFHTFTQLKRNRSPSTINQSFWFFKIFFRKLNRLTWQSPFFEKASRYLLIWLFVTKTPCVKTFITRFGHMWILFINLKKALCYIDRNPISYAVAKPFDCELIT